MILVRRKPYNKIQLNIQFTVYQLSDRVDKREESQETSYTSTLLQQFYTLCSTALSWSRGYSIFTFTLKGVGRGASKCERLRTVGRELSVRMFENIFLN